MLYPDNSKNSAARLSPSRPLTLRSSAKRGFRFRAGESECELRLAHAPPSRPVVHARAVLFERLQMFRGRIALVIGEAVARLEFVQLAQQCVTMNFGYDRSGRNDRAARVAFDQRLLRAGERLDADRVSDEVLGRTASAASAPICAVRLTPYCKRILHSVSMTSVLASP